MKLINKIGTVIFVTIAACTIFQTTQTIHATSGKQALDVSDVRGVPIRTAIIPFSKERRPGIKMTPTYITIHNTGNRDYGADAEMHHNLVYYTTTSETSWHYTVDDTKIYQHIPLNEVGYHSGDNNGKGNFQSVGIEICENQDGNYQQAETNAEKLAARLLYEYDLDISRLVTHNYWSGKDCPHNLLNNDYGSEGWDVFKINVQYELDKLMLENASDNTTTSSAISLKKGETKNIGISSMGNNPTYSFEKTSNYGLQISEVASGKYYIDSKKGYTPKYELSYAILETTIQSDEDSFEKLLATLKDATIGHSINNIVTIENNKLKLLQSGNDIVTIQGKQGKIKVAIKVSITGKPMIITDDEGLMISSGLDIFVLKSNSKKTEWTSSNEKIVKIVEGKIVGVNTGEAVISTTMNNIKIERKIIIT